jgi:two-component system chemotaxis sensor kinase CheA
MNARVAMFANLRGIGGSTILSSGVVALNLDVAALMNFAARSEEDRLLPPQFTTMFSVPASNSSAVKSRR